MIYGPNTADVQEVIDFARSGELLCDPRPPHGQDIKIINDIAEIDDYVDPPDDASEDVWNWLDIRGAGGTGGFRLEAAVHKKLNREWFERLTPVWDEAYHILDMTLGPRVGEACVQEILGDHEWIAACRAAFGRSLPFIERLFELYRLGCYPCGWEGYYPAGRMVVYVPVDDESGDTHSWSS